MVPETSLFTDTDLAIGNDGIIVNDKMETNLPGVYAVGDCVQYTSGITGEVLSGKLATNAVPMAKVLGLNLLGIQRTYPGFFNGAAGCRSSAERMTCSASWGLSSESSTSASSARMKGSSTA